MLQSRLTRLFQQRQVRKFYLARVTGTLGTHGKRIHMPLKKGRKSRYRVQASGHIVQGVKVDAEPATAGDHPASRRRRSLPLRTARPCCRATIDGRTHQLRVHLSWIGHPIVGDHIYGRPDAPEQQASRLLLHCDRLVVPGFGLLLPSVQTTTYSSAQHKAGCGRPGVSAKMVATPTPVIQLRSWGSGRAADTVRHSCW